MNQKYNGPYKHYERPSQTRTTTHKSVSRAWIAFMALLLILAIALVPVVHYLAQGTKAGNQVVEVQSAKKTKKQSQKSNLKKELAKTNQKPQTKPKKKQVAVKYYVVKNGDSLTGIAKQFNMAVSNLAQLNQLDVNSQVDVGQTLRIR